MSVTNLAAALARRLRIGRRATRSISATAILAGGMMFAGPAEAQLFSENFDGLTLGPFVSSSETGGDGTDWTDVPPTGWTRNNTTTPVGGPSEFFGFTFLDKNSWIATAGNQDRDDFTRGTGTVMVADPDEYDDDAGAGGVLGGSSQAFNAFLQTPPISLSGVTPGSVVLSFDSSFRPYQAMTGLVDVSFNGGTTFANVLTLNTANTPGGNSSLARANESVVVPLNNPAEANSVIVRFGMTNADNDWWWAIDNIQVRQGLPALNLEVNRDTGAITLVNQTGSPVSFKSYSITSANGALEPASWLSIAENYDAGSPGPNQVDPTRNWSELTEPTANGDLSEADLQAAAGATIAHTRSINLGNAWIRTPTEDLTFQYISGTQVVQGIVNYTGHSGSAFANGDFNRDSAINSADWMIFRANQHGDFTGKSGAEAYLMGDISGDFQNNHTDFIIFKSLYDAANGAGSFLAMVSSVPEPSSAILVLTAGLFMLPRRANPRK